MNIHYHSEVDLSTIFDYIELTSPFKLHPQLHPTDIKILYDILKDQKVKLSQDIGLDIIELFDYKFEHPGQELINLVTNSRNLKRLRLKS